MRNFKNMHLLAAMSGLMCSISAEGTGQFAGGSDEKPRQPVRYRVKEKSLIDNQLYAEGAEVLYAGLPGTNLEPLDAEGEARAQEYKDRNKVRVEEMIANNKDGNISDTSALMQRMIDQQKQSSTDLENRMANAIAKGISEGMAAIMASQQKPEASADRPQSEARLADRNAGNSVKMGDAIGARVKDDPEHAPNSTDKGNQGIYEDGKPASAKQAGAQIADATSGISETEQHATGDKSDKSTKRNK
jgi:hypothetical protein